MAKVRCLMEIGMGVDLHGRDYTSAARRAVEDALRHTSLGFQRLAGKRIEELQVDITIGVPRPEAVDREAVAAALPHGKGNVNPVPGGLEVPHENPADAVVIATAVVTISLDDGRN